MWNNHQEILSEKRKKYVYDVLLFLYEKRVYIYIYIHVHIFFSLGKIHKKTGDIVACKKENHN